MINIKQKFANKPKVVIAGFGKQASHPYLMPSTAERR
jgi:hypothetical protein